MDPVRSKTALLYSTVRRALQSGRYVPGERIDPGSLAHEFHMSQTPVRCALYRLAGEGVIVDHPRHGFQVPLPTELGLRDQYDWMEQLLVMACASPVREGSAHFNVLAAVDDDLPKRTWKLFDAIARSSGQWSLHQAVRRNNDRLAPIRRASLELKIDVPEELDRLQQLFVAHDLQRLEHALRDYHAHRKQLVPQIVALLAERRDRLH
ncbi:GntR family transcriptional regulator [Pseudoxanthomonas winnipegensis]|uniref:GntR family transcriptional regulator n=1 Tax=Pseudoxanthomonas winnipegensis TaxID=2480810 RepID=UPI0030F43075